MHEGLVSGNDPVSKWLPEVDAVKAPVLNADGTPFVRVPLLVEHLYQHTSGLPRQPSKSPLSTSNELLAALSAETLLFGPGNAKPTRTWRRDSSDRWSSAQPSNPSGRSSTNVSRSRLGRTASGLRRMFPLGSLPGVTYRATMTFERWSRPTSGHSRLQADSTVPPVI